MLTSKEKVARIDRLASRHIAKCLDFLGDTVAPTQIVTIKRSFRFFADDAKRVISEETSNEPQDHGE